MSDDLARERSIFRLHCLHRLAKLRSKLEDADWGLSAGQEIVLLAQIQTALTLMLHDLGIESYISEDINITDRLDRKS